MGKPDANKDPWGRPRNPRPKGAQKETLFRDKGRLGNDGLGPSPGMGCLMALAMLPALPVLALARRRRGR